MEIKLCKLTKEYGQILAVNQFDACFFEGELVTILGPSGCGKTTLLNLLAGLTKASSGSLYFEQQEATNIATENREIGFVFQTYALFPHMTVLENICFSLYHKELTKQERELLATDMAKLVQIEDLLDRKPNQLSGGQQQRVSIARALVRKPKLLLLDEPLSGLDTKLRKELRDEIHKIQKEMAVTTIFVTHDYEDALEISDRIIIMNEGKLIQFDTPSVLYQNPNNFFVLDFLTNGSLNCISGSINNNFFTPNESKNSWSIFQSIQTSINDIDLVILPENINLCNDDSSLKGIITNIHFKKTSIHFTIEIEGIKLQGITNKKTNLQIGEEIGIHLDEQDIFLFDHKTGNRIVSSSLDLKK